MFYLLRLREHNPVGARVPKTRLYIECPGCRMQYMVKEFALTYSNGARIEKIGDSNGCYGKERDCVFSRRMKPSRHTFHWLPGNTL